ncbi:MAG: redoxin domain-containing protein [Actinomycetota bacterium]|nr:MAG: redoxin domain-containing protein [Actinomycetota bacterium]
MAGLRNGTRFPRLVMAKVGGGELHLPDDLQGSYGVVLAYRGSWCTRCNAQLASFQHFLASLGEAGIEVAAFSTDDEVHAEEMVANHGLEFPVGFGVDLETVGELLKGYINEEHRSLESSNFLLHPDGAIELAVYASGPIGRLAPEDVIDVVNRRRAR